MPCQVPSAGSYTALLVVGGTKRSSGFMLWDVPYAQCAYLPSGKDRSQSRFRKVEMGRAERAAVRRMQRLVQEGGETLKLEAWSNASCGHDRRVARVRSEKSSPKGILEWRSRF